MYQAAFVRHAHRLMLAGYKRMADPHLRATAQEEDISGDLCAKMDAITQSEGWAAFYIVRNEAPLNQADRKGKRRFRIDIEIQKCLDQPGPRPIFRWEAKRLGKGNGTDEYLGPSGLGCLTDGRYTAGQSDAGMVAFVQNETRWIPLIEKGLRKRRARLALLSGPEIRPSVGECSELEGFLTRHTNIDVHHVLLKFSP